MSTLTRSFAAAAAFISLTACGSADRYQGLEAADLYRMALQEYEEGDYDNVVAALGRLLGTYGNWERVPDARLLLGHAYFAQEDFLTARTEYNRFLERYPGHRDAPAAGLGVCQSLAALSPHPQRDQAFTLDAMTTCRNIVIDYAGTPAAAAAAAVANRMRFKLAEKEFQNAEFYYRRKLYDSAIRYYEFVLALYAETEFAPRALLGLYRSNLAVEYDDLAEEAKQRLLREYPDSDAAREVRTNGAGS